MNKQNLKKIRDAILLQSAMLALSASSVLAAVKAKPGDTDFVIDQPDNVLTDLPQVLSGGIQLLIILAGIIAFVFLLLGGIKWITSGGDKGNVEAARNQIVQALIGLIVVFASWGLIILIQNVTGFCLGFGADCPIKLEGIFQ